MAMRGKAWNVFFSGGFAWVHSKDQEGDSYGPGNWQGINVQTGKVEKEVPGSFTDKCALGTATQRFLITGRVDFFDWKTGEQFSPAVVRSACDFGCIPAHGMITTFPTDCQCFPQIKGISGIGPAPANPSPSAPDAPSPLLHGPAWETRNERRPTKSDAEDWPLYRHDAERSGFARTDVPVDNLTKRWSVDVGPRPSQATISNGTLFVSTIESRRIIALSTDDGKHRWSYSTGARIDTPPTCHDGMVLFGSRDGRVYCLDAASGKLIWRFRAAPREQRMLAYGQPESSWPVPGSLPIVDGKLFVVAGRHTGLDGGLFVYSLDPATGKVAWQSQPTHPWFADLPVRGDKYVYVGRLKFDPRTGENPRFRRGRDIFFNAGKSSPFVDATYAVRTQWSARTGTFGQMLCVDNDRVLGFRGNVSKGKATITRPGRGDYQLFMTVADEEKWKTQLSIRPTSLLLTPNVAFVAGPPDAYPYQGGSLHWYSTTDGKELGQLKLSAAPTFDGMSAAHGRLYIATEDGRTQCFGTP